MSNSYSDWYITDINSVFDGAGCEYFCNSLEEAQIVLDFLVKNKCEAKWELLPDIEEILEKHNNPH
jgi:hypothetical protein